MQGKCERTLARRFRTKIKGSDLATTKTLPGVCPRSCLTTQDVCDIEKLQTVFNYS